MSRKTVRVLLVEDNPGDARLVQHFLSRCKEPVFEVRHETSLTKGLKRLQPEAVDVVILDLHLPDQNGFDTFFDALAGAGNIPIVVLTGSSLRPFAEDSVRAHAAEFLEKFDLDQGKLVKALLRALSKRAPTTDLDFPPV